ncbi:MAG: radical SAM protein [Proteobacteria bacterium]|nr:radical SAM protein [Pseudomonadota bacterium]
MNFHRFSDAEFLAERGAAQSALHNEAAAVTREHFGRAVFVRGVVEVSNHCRENCHYCGMRRDNRSLDRYRATHDQLAELIIHHRPVSLTDVNIQTGEDPVAVREIVLPLIRTLRCETPLGVSVCLGTLNEALYDELLAAGASLYIIKFELADAARYAEFEAPGTLAERLRHIRLLAARGWRISSGFIAGLPGQSADDLVANLRLMGELPLDGCSVSPFIPGEATPLTRATTGDLDTTLNCMAALRLLRPELVIPAVSALNLTGADDGYRRGLQAGANLCTINLTPSEMRDNYLLYKRQRFIMNEERVLAAIAAEGLEVSRVGLTDHWRAAPALAEAMAG